MLSATSRTRSAGGRHIPSYQCRRGAHLTRAAESLDQFVAALVIERLSRADARLLLASEDRRADVEALRAQRDDIAGRQTELAGLFADGAITGPQLAEGTRKLAEQAEALDREISAATSSSPLAGFADAEDVAAAWTAAPVSRRKAVIRALMTVTLDKATPGRPRGWQAGTPYFDPRFVRIAWHV